MQEKNKKKKAWNYISQNFDVTILCRTGTLHKVALKNVSKVFAKSGVYGFYIFPLCTTDNMTDNS